jgi:hypothetical protein
VEGEESVVGVPVTVAEPLAGGVLGTGNGGMAGCENCPHAAAHVRIAAHKTRMTIAVFQRGACTQCNRAHFLVANARIKNIRRTEARTTPGRLGKGVRGARGGRGTPARMTVSVIVTVVVPVAVPGLGLNVQVAFVSWKKLGHVKLI